MQAALDEAGKVVKKQKTCSERVDGSIDQLISLVLATRARLASGPQPGAIKELKTQVQKLELEKEMNSQTKELHTAIGKLNKVRAQRACAACQWPRTGRCTPHALCYASHWPSN